MHVHKKARSWAAPAYIVNRCEDRCDWLDHDACGARRGCSQNTAACVRGYGCVQRSVLRLLTESVLHPMTGPQTFNFLQSSLSW